MRRRRGGPGVLGTVARTAVIAGTATAVSNKVSQAGAARAAAQHQQMAQQAAPAVSPPAAMVEAAPAPAPSGADDLLAKLKHLAQMRTMDVLSDEEFSRAAVKLLTD